MKKTLVVALSALVIATTSFMSQAAIEDDLKNVCTIVKNNDKSELRKKMKKIRNNYKLRISDYYTGISCGSDSLIRWAMKNNAHDAGDYVIKKMSKSALGKPESDGKTIEQWAQDNGHIGKPLGIALIDRLN